MRNVTKQVISYHVHTSCGAVSTRLRPMIVCDTTTFLSKCCCTNPQISWGPKSGSVEQIAKSMNIGIDTLALIDDTAFERQQVQSVWPQVRTYDVTEVNSLLARPEFDMPATAESRSRRAMYRAEEQRNTLMKADHMEIQPLSTDVCFDFPAGMLFLLS